MDANGWTIIITGTIAAVIAGLPGIATFILSIRNSKKLTAQDAVLAGQDAKLDSIHDATNGTQEKLIAVTARSSFQEGIAAQKAISDGIQRRSTDKE